MSFSNTCFTVVVILFMHLYTICSGGWDNSLLPLSLSNVLKCFLFNSLCTDQLVVSLFRCLPCVPKSIVITSELKLFDKKHLSVYEAIPFNLSSLGK